MTKFRLANPCQNKESNQKEHDERDKKKAIVYVFSTHPFVLKRGRPR